MSFQAYLDAIEKRPVRPLRSSSTEPTPAASDQRPRPGRSSHGSRVSTGSVEGMPWHWFTS